MNQNKYIAFSVLNREFYISIDKVLEINRVGDLKITKAILAPDYVIGIISFKGEAVHLIDLALKLNYGTSDVENKNKVIILQEDNSILGFLADRVYKLTDPARFLDEKITDLETILYA